MNIGPTELIIVLAIVLLLFGSTKLPKLARSLGQASNEFKKGLDEGGSQGPTATPTPTTGPAETPEPRSRRPRSEPSGTTAAPASFWSMTDGVPTWEEVARDHGRFLYNVAYRLTGNDDEAQDLVQESLLRIRRGLERYEPGSLKVGWPGS